MAQQYAIELKGITKTFGSVVANNNVELNVRPGEILALLGENGSGKTTLMNMLSGIYQPDRGRIFVDGKEVTIDSPETAKKLGIGMVHQRSSRCCITARRSLFLMNPRPFSLCRRSISFSVSCAA